MSKIKGPNIQKIRQKRSNLDNSDNAAKLSYQTCRAAFMTEEGLPNLGISLVKISFSLWRTNLKNNNLSGINTYGIFFTRKYYISLWSQVIYLCLLYATMGKEIKFMEKIT